MRKSNHHHYSPFPFLPTLILLIFSQLSVHGSSASTTLSLTLSCGANKPGTDANGRRWDPDTQYLHSPPPQVSSATALTQDPSLPSPIPYMSARIIRFGGEAVYKLPTATGARYFLRLHFYPASYGPDLDITKSFFSTTANGLTLLSNFSAALTGQALTQSYLIREFSLSPSKGSNSSSLTLTFTPNSNSFAFINAIELVEFPANNTLFNDFPLTGADHLANETSLNLQTMIRLNVGGAFIPPTNDTSGLTRTWYDDTPYLSGANSGVTASVNDTVPVLYRHGQSLEGVTAESAPAELYRSWRGMGPDPNLTLHYNLTWDFQVDPGFTYIVRMHFCEMRYSLLNQRVFYVYINGRNVFGHREMGFDVIMWAGGKGVPVYKDFATHVVKRKAGGGDDEAVITVGLHPFDKGSLKPEFYDAILNGLEIFKIGDGKKGLSGPNPAISRAMARAEERRRSGFVEENGDGGEGNAASRRVSVIGAAASGVAVFGVAAVLGIALCRKKNRYLRCKSHSSWLPIVYSSTATSKSTLSTTSVASAQVSTEAAANCRHFSVSEIKQATKDFDESHVIGVGGFGKVYRGLIDGGKIPVAIKRSNPSSSQGVNEFVTEIEMLSKLRHKHLVSLMGYCEEEGEMILVYDYMARGTLREHLYNKSSGSNNNKTDLDWRQRLEILIGAAKGLHYLHTGAKYTIIHRDVKTTNILLDEKWVSKVSDFGLSKTGPELSHQSHVSTVVKGSFGYLDPEYFKRQKLTEKSDVYSFGVVIFEVLCARPALNHNLPKEQVSLAEWALNCVRQNKLVDIIDPQIKGTINRQCLKKVVDTGVKCLSDHGVNRPTMSDLLWNLESALHLQDEGGGGGGSVHKDLTTSFAGQQQKRPHSDSINMHLSTLSLREDDLSAMALHPSGDRDEEKEDCSEIFSQIVHQAGR